MGFFDDSICTCCVCPMQCVLKQLIGQEVQIVTGSSGLILELSIQIEEVKNFIVSGTDISSGSRNRINLPICKIMSVTPPSGAFPINLKPIQKSTIGECVCCEDPITDLANSLRGRVVTIFPISGFFNGEVTIREVGEGIVIVQELEEMMLVVLSSCSINLIAEGTIIDGLEIFTRRKISKKPNEGELKFLSI